MQRNLVLMQEPAWASVAERKARMYRINGFGVKLVSITDSDCSLPIWSEKRHSRIVCIVA